MSVLRLTVAAQALFFLGWWGYLGWTERSSREVWLETRPVDPRDLISGHYVALRYPIETACQPSRDRDGAVWFVKLAPQGRSVRVSEGDRMLWEAVQCASSPGASGPNEVWVRAQRFESGLRFGIERYYVSESSSLRSAQSGDVVAQANVGANHQLRLVSLVPIQR